MTKSELKQIIKGLIVESINESKSKNFVSSKKKNKLKEQDEMQPVDSQSSAEPNAGEMQGPPTAEETDYNADELLSQIDTIIGSLNSLKSSLQGHDGDEELDGEPEDEQV